LSLEKYIVRISLALFLFVGPQKAASQDLLVERENLGFSVGANLAFGSHFQRLGLVLNFFYGLDPFQLNSELRANINFKSPGPKGAWRELVFSQGLVWGYGAAQYWYNPFLGPVSNQTGYSNSLAYSYNLYFDNRKTTQQTGLLAIQVREFSLIVENDILARTYYDRFRTGAFLLQYQFEDKFQAALNCTMWTGKMGRTVGDSSCGRFCCYMDTTNGRYALNSHGLLSAQFKYNLGYSQNVQANVGVDAEQVRNVMQNKLIHDMPIIPRKWIKAKNCYIPMLDSTGNQYLYKPEQRIRSPRLYWNLFSNAPVFY
jgi:hypothetical protein